MICHNCCAASDLIDCLLKCLLPLAMVTVLSLLDQLLLHILLLMVPWPATVALLRLLDRRLLCPLLLVRFAILHLL